MLDILNRLPHQSGIYNSTEWLSDPGLYPNYCKIWKELNPSTVLEIGAFLGMSLCAAVYSVEDLYLIDFVDDESGLRNSNQMAIDNIKFVEQERYGVNRVSIAAHTSYNTPYFNNNFVYDVIHVDGNHQYQFVKKDLEFAALLEPEFIMGHDLHLGQGTGVFKAVSEFCQQRKLRWFGTRDITNGLFVISLAENETFLPKSLNFDQY